MTSFRSFINQDLGLLMIDSLWQGLVIGLILAISLIFSHKSTVRYSVACIALALILILPIISYIDLPTFYSHKPAISDIETVVLNRSPEPTMLNQTTPTPSPVASPRAFTLANTIYTSQKLESYLPWLSLFWILGVLILSLRLGINLYLVERYRKHQVQAAPEWIQQKLQSLSQKLNLKKSVQLLQSSILDIPAAVGFFKPVILLPASAICGLSPNQLELILAHELAHIQRRDYLVNLLQTLAETLLFYHPVVWWISGIIRQEREHICDDRALQITGQERIVYAETLGRLETLRGNLAMTATGGNLVARIRRLLGRPAKRELQWIPSLTALALTVLCVFALNNTFAQSISEPQQISRQPNILSTIIAVNPTNPDQIAMNTTIATESDCQPLKCDIHGVLYTTLDGGKTWQEQVGKDKVLSNNVYVNSLGEVYDFGNLYDFYRADSFDNVRTFLNVFDPVSPLKYAPSGNLVLQKSLSSIDVIADPNTKVSYLAYASHNGNITEGGDILLEQRVDGKLIKITTVARLTYQKGDDDSILGIPMDIQIVSGDFKTISVLWNTHEGDGPNSPTFITTSTDGGETFSEPQKLALALYATYDIEVYENNYYLTGLEISDNKPVFTLLKYQDSGKTWESYPLKAIPEITDSHSIFILTTDVSQNGVIDIAYALSSLECLDNQSELLSQPQYCDYDVYYTYSINEGKTFSQPEKINPLPVTAKERVRTLSFVFPSISVASTNQEALISWVGTKDGQGTQAYLTRVKR